MNGGASGLLLLLFSLFLHVLVVLVVRLQQLVPPGEGGGVVPDEVHVVEVVETGTGVERDQVERVQRDVVTAVDVNGLQQAEGHPGPQEEDVVTEDHDADEETSSQDECLSRMSVFCLHAKRRGELVVDFVDVFVDPAVVKQAMEEVVPGVFNNSTAKTLSQEVRPARHGVPVIRDVEEFSEVVSPADQRQLDAEMVEQQHLETSPLFLPGLWFVRLDLVFLHEGHELEDETRQAEEEVDELVDDEGPPGGNLKLGVVVQHVAPGVFQRGLEGVFWQHGINILRRKVGRAQDVCRAVHLHDG